MTSKRTLAYVVKCPEQLGVLTTRELEVLRDQHELEMTSLQSRMDLTLDDDRFAGMQRAFNALALHKKWINREIMRRQEAESKARKNTAPVLVAQFKAEKQLELERLLTERQKSKDAAKSERIKLSNEASLQQMFTFKRHVRNLLGDEQYQKLWDEVNKELANAQ